MRKNFLPKIIIAVILALLVLHFLVSNVSVTQEGSWKRPNLSFSYSGPGSKPVTEDPTDSSKSDDIEHDKPPSMWDELYPTSTTELHQSHAYESPGYQSTEYNDLPDVIPPVASLEPLHTSAVGDDTSASHTELASLPEHTQHAAESLTHSAPAHVATHDVHAHHGNETKLPCSELEGAEDVVLIIKTGATEVDEKIPVHFNTTLRCFPNYLIFSDFGEEFQGHTIHDALGEVIDQVRLENDDFDLWRRLHDKGRASLAANELSINDHADPNGGGGNPDNGGWRLDKFKNIPMVNYTIHKYPDAKWFIYTDADTYIVWSNLLKWVKQMDHTKLSYLGSAAMIDDQVFGHGGSGYLMSNALMKKAADIYNTNQTQWDQYAAGHWAGDCVLATLLEQIGAPLSWAYPIIQGGDPIVMNFWETGYDRRLWCYPAVSYHHIKPATVASLWELEQEWLGNANSSTRDMHHSDVYKQWFLPQLSHERMSWDNLAEDETTGHDITDAWGCRDYCQTNSTCMQWTWKDNTCRTFDTTRLGHESEGMQAGWMIERINEKIVELDKCEEGEWLFPDHKKTKRMDRRELARQADRKYR